MKESEFESQCDHVGLSCPEEYTCYCRPCIKAFEVDVLEWTGTEDEQNVGELSGKRDGCGKMVMCGTVEREYTYSIG